MNQPTTATPFTLGQLRTRKATLASLRTRDRKRADKCAASLAELGWLALPPEAQAALGEAMMERVRDAIVAATNLRLTG